LEIFMVRWLSFVRRSATPVAALSLLTLAVSVSTSACADPEREETDTTQDELRSITKSEALAELSQVGDAIRAYYGPLEYKRFRFGFQLNDALAEAKAEIEKGEDEADFVRPIYRLLAKMHDGHVSYVYPMKNDKASEYNLPFLVSPFGSEYVITHVPEDNSAGLKRGDVLVSIDGIDTDEMARSILPLVGTGQSESDAHYVALAMTIRPFYTEKALRPKGETAQVVVRHADGSQTTADVPWTVVKGGLAGQVTPPAAPAGPHSVLAYSDRLEYLLRRESGTASIAEQGSLTPFYLTAEVKKALGVVEVAPKPATLASFGVTIPETDATAPEHARLIQLHAYKYAFAGKTILLVRIPTYNLPNGKFNENTAWLGALLKDNLKDSPVGGSVADTPADVVVLDDTHNPGGAVAFGTGIVSLFTSAPIPNVVQAHHADRAWIDQFSAMLGGLDGVPPEMVDPVRTLILDRRVKIEAAYDAREVVAPFMPLAGAERGPSVPLTLEGALGENMLAPHPLVQWNKPVLVLTDELAGSCADIVPLLIKHGGIGKTFGARTMGLGGNVEPVLTQPFSRATLNMTRGLFGAYRDDPNDIPLVENNGVVPDFAHAHTAADFRAGYVGYAKAFSEAAATLRR
jgi:hypothetical protein